MILAALRPSAASRRVDACRVCGARRFYPYLALGRTPLANAYLQKRDLNKPEFSEELTIQLCLSCGLSQLTRVVHPDRMFRHYLYVSSTPRTFRDHCADMAASVAATLRLAPGDLVVDIGSNDGCLLSAFRARGCRVAGVDPARNLSAEANARGIPTLCGYWSASMASRLVRRFGRPRVVTSTNVLAHTDDVRGFADAVRRSLAPGGVWVIEVPYLLDFIRKNEFDTAYHEHLSYMALSPLVRLLNDHGLDAVDVVHFPGLHGGTLRVIAAATGSRRRSPRVARRLAAERAFGVGRPAAYRAFSRRVLRNRRALRTLVSRLLAQGKTIWAYGASAKGNTLMNFFGLTQRQVPVVIDDNPKKWGLFAPGSRMSITGIAALPKARVDYLVLLAWNFRKEIMARCRAAGYRGRFITPVPTARVLSGGAR